MEDYERLGPKSLKVSKLKECIEESKARQRDDEIYQQMSRNIEPLGIINMLVNDKLFNTGAQRLTQVTDKHFYNDDIILNSVRIGLNVKEELNKYLNAPVALTNAEMVVYSRKTL